MSTFKVPLTKILEINPHPNADSLEIAKVYNYNVIIPKFIYKPGDIVIYVPVGSVLSPKIEELLFPSDAKVKPTKSRIRAIKLRGEFSEGLLVDPCIIPELNKLPIDSLEVLLENDLSETLGISKYQEPVKDLPNLMKVNPLANPYKIREFKEYTEVEHGKYYDRMVMTTGETVVITQKLHGTAARYGYFKRPVVSFWDRCLNAVGLLPGWTFCWGSRRVQIQTKPDQAHSGFKSEKQGCDFGDVYTKIAKQENLRNRIPKGYAIYGEIVGWGIQKGYLYNCGLNEHKFYVYDVMKDGKWLDWADAKEFCMKHGFEMVPELYIGPYTMDKVKELLPVNVISYEPNEGVVVTPIKERYSDHCGRVKLKYINEEYLMLKDGTEFQ